MWEISTETVVAAAHRLHHTTGKDEGLHHHEWRIRAVVRANALDATGWVLDFNHLAATLRALVEPYGRALLNELPPFDDLNPTRENVARVIADGLAAKLDDARAHVHRVEVWENDIYCATYFRGPAGLG